MMVLQNMFDDLERCFDDIERNKKRLTEGKFDFNGNISKQETMDNQELSHKATIEEMNKETSARASEIESLQHLVESVTSELSACDEDRSILESENGRLVTLLSEKRRDKDVCIKEFDDLTSCLLSRQNKLVELNRDLSNSQKTNERHLQAIGRLEDQDSKLQCLRESLSSETANLTTTLNKCMGQLNTLERFLESIAEELIKCSTDVENYNSHHITLYNQIATIQSLEQQWLKTFQSIENTAIIIEQMESKICELDTKNSLIVAEISEWRNRNEALKANLDVGQKAMNELEASKMSLTAMVENDTCRSQQLSKEIDDLNKTITQSRILLEDLRAKFTSEQNERSIRFSELQQNQQRHLDEYKEKQSVKICDLKSALKSQRETILQSKREECAQALEQHTAKLRAEMEELERSRERKLKEEARLITQLQTDLNKLRNETRQQCV
ncbi:sporulation-specific 15-like, putative [Babesia ovis]|uniref:Sporulation-specific 15-like, putative n=1 Tax=Babesia ovis TaxID=5869 RepID=A0A9W5WU30_BABOV|nr:sporulation-specific 15-like, putative [Babesia ovis]